MTVNPHLPPVDVVEVATAVLVLGNRRATMVSTQETIAMAAAIVNFSEALSQTAFVLHLIETLGENTGSAELKQQTDDALAQLSELLAAVGFKQVEEVRHAASS
ncbi:hypothetical protein QMT40_003010 [Parvibaculaceae bacterium PLY_AMNH_Bact1]|nr:hypothetical protein QMT40_003010 [Parvibaculaceae bacterium PLY_AMNH_Bact1]